MRSSPLGMPSNLPSWLGRFSWALFAAALIGCAPEQDAPDYEEEENVEVSDDELEAGFDKNRLLSDAAFTDSGAMSAAEIQEFLDTTPYGGTSGLAGYVSGGKTAATAIADAAALHQINPLVILVRAQMEQSLIGKSKPSKTALDFAFGCGCPDNSSCSEQWRGFHKQVDCMAKHMREYLDDLDGGGTTVAGWRVGQAKKTLDPSWVTPKNKATAALYTYTPWVGGNGFGNLGHFQIWKKFASHAGYLPAGPGGCPAISYPAGLVAQSLPAPAMTEAYGAQLTGFGLVGAPPQCFLDPMNLENPSTGTKASADSKVVQNFRLSELLVGESGARQVLVDPGFVQRLQTFRTKLGLPVTVVDGFRTPERHLGLCDQVCTGCREGCEQTLSMTLGQGAIVTAAASPQSLLGAASFAGFSTCWVDGADLYVDVASPGLGCFAQ